MVEGLSKGNEYAATIDRISGSGNGIVELETGHLNLGSMSVSKEGKVVSFTYKGGDRGSFIQIGATRDSSIIKDLKHGTDRTPNKSNPMSEQSGSKNKLLNGNQ